MQDAPVWIPIQTAYNKEMEVARMLHERDIEYYIPMVYTLKDVKDDPGRCERILVPAIHNLLFIHVPYDREWCKTFAREALMPLYFLKRERHSEEFAIISNKEMDNFMRATDPEIEGTRFIDAEKLKDKPGTPVRIIKKGPLYGVTGRFVRYGGRHYIAIRMAQSTALLRVSYTWCQEIDEEEL